MSAQALLLLLGAVASLASGLAAVLWMRGGRASAREHGLRVDVAKLKSELDGARASARDLEARNRDLASSIDRLGSARQAIIHTEKMASLGRMAAGVAHEFNNPAQHFVINLPFLKRNIDKLKELIRAYQALPPADPAQAKRIGDLATSLKVERAIADLDEILEGFFDGTTKIATLVKDLATFSRLDSAGVKTVDLRDGIDSTLNLLAFKLRGRIEVRKEYAELPPIECYAGQMNHVFMNILANAAEAIPEKGDIWIRTEAVGPDRVRVTITDSGTGIAEETLGRIFDPFFTTKEQGQGTGLGLTTSYDIVRRHGGEITVASEVGVGTVFRVELPVKLPAKQE